MHFLSKWAITEDNKAKKATEQTKILYQKVETCSQKFKKSAKMINFAN